MPRRITNTLEIPAKMLTKAVIETLKRDHGMSTEIVQTLDEATVKGELRGLTVSGVGQADNERRLQRLEAKVG